MILSYFASSLHATANQASGSLIPFFTSVQWQIKIQDQNFIINTFLLFYCPHRAPISKKIFLSKLVLNQQFDIHEQTKWSLWIWLPHTLFNIHAAPSIECNVLHEKWFKCSLWMVLNFFILHTCFFSDKSCLLIL